MWTRVENGAILCPSWMAEMLHSGRFFSAHLAITVPVVLAVSLAVYWGLGEFGPFLWPYYSRNRTRMAVVIDRTSTLERGAEKKRSSGQSDRRCSTTQRLRLAQSRSNRVFCASHDRCHLSRDFLWPMAAPSLVCLDITSTSNLACQPQNQLLAATSGIGRIIPAFIFGALVAHYFQKVASWAWVVPTIFLS